MAYIRYVGEKKSYPSHVCRICGRVWVVAENQKTGLSAAGYTCPRCSPKRRGAKK